MKNKKVFLWSIIWTFTIFVVAIVFFVSFIQKIDINRINLYGDIAFSVKDLKKYMGIELPIPYAKANIKAMKKAIEAHPLVYKSHIRKTLRGEINITLERSIPLVVVLAKVNGKEVPAYFDKTGKSVQVGLQGGIVDVPVLSGIEIINPEVGVFLPQWVVTFLKKVAIIKKENKAVFSHISEWRIVSFKDGYRIIELWFKDYQSKFITEVDISTEKLEKIWYFAENITKEGFFNGFESFDVRQGVIIGKKWGNNEET